MKRGARVHWYLWDDTVYACGRPLMSGECSVNLSAVTCRQCLERAKAVRPGCVKA